MEPSNPFDCCGVPRSTKHHSSTKYYILIILILILTSSLSGCVSMSDPEASQVYTSDIIGVLSDQSSLGQSFISRRPNLNGLTIWISRLPGTSGQPASQNSSYLTVRLYYRSIDTEPVYTAVVAVPLTGSNLPVTIKIPNQNNPGGQGYYLLLNNGSGTIQVNGRKEDAYALGQAFVSNSPINADLAFQLTYDYGFSAMIGDLRSSFSWIWLFVPLLVVLWIPGWLLMDVSGQRTRFDFGEQTAISIGLSLALIPLLMLWTTVLKIKWTQNGVLFVAGFLLFVFLARLIYLAITYRIRRSKNLLSLPGEKPDPHGWKSFSASFSPAALVLIFMAALMVRFIMVRDLATPAWVDFVHHALITRLIMENGSFPSTYQPYFDFASTAYHPGFHSIAAVFTWLSRLDLSRSLLILGQVLNALAVFPVYLLTKIFTRSQAAGLCAALITGFLTPMPAYYTSWGRYTELTGLLLLPIVLAFLQVWMDGNSGRSHIWLILLGSLSAGGLFLVHYRVLVFMVCLVLSYLLVHLVRHKDTSVPKAIQLLILAGCMAVLGVIIVLPWFIPAFTTTLLPRITSSITDDQLFFQDFSWPYLLSALGKQSLVLAGLGLVWAISRRKLYSLVLIIWVFLLFLLANLSPLKLPGGGLISNGSVEIMLFIPISLLGGYFISELLARWKDLLPSWTQIPIKVAILFLFGYVAFLGARQLIPILNPVTILTRNADLPAIAWIKENIPPDETIVINPFAWGYGLYAGNDGGYWILPLSGNFTLPPPVIYGLSSNATQINQLIQQVIDAHPDPAMFLEFMRSNQLSYIYCGVRGGVISSQMLADSGLFNVLYHKEGVWIFSIKP